MKLGINGLGRIGKLSMWHHVARKHFSALFVLAISETIARLGMPIVASFQLPTTRTRPLPLLQQSESAENVPIPGISNEVDCSVCYLKKLNPLGESSR